MTGPGKKSGGALAHGFAFVIALALAASAMALILKPSYVPLVRVAIAVPLSGEDSISGNELLKGAQLALGALQEKLLPFDHRFEIYWIDDHSTVDGARAAALRIVSDPRTVAVIGHFSSANTLAALPIYRTAGLPVIMPIATLTAITKDGAFPNAFRMPPTNEQQGQTLVAFLREYLKAGQIFVLHDDTDYSRNLASSISIGLRARQSSEAGIEVVSRGDSNFPVLQMLTAFEPPVDAVVYVGYSPEAVYVARQLSALATLDAPLVATDGVYGRRFLEAPGSGGAYVVYQVPPMDTLVTRPQWRTYEELFRAEGLTGSPEGWASWGYDATNLAYTAVEKSLQITRVPRSGVVLDVLSGNSPEKRPFRTAGALGDYEFDGQNDNKHAQYWIHQVVEGQYRAVPWTFGTSVSGEAGRTR